MRHIHRDEKKPRILENYSSPSSSLPPRCREKNHLGKFVEGGCTSGTRSAAGSRVHPTLIMQTQAGAKTCPVEAGLLTSLARKGLSFVWGLGKRGGGRDDYSTGQTMQCGLPLIINVPGGIGMGYYMGGVRKLLLLLYRTPMQGVVKRQKRRSVVWTTVLHCKHALLLY